MDSRLLDSFLSEEERIARIQRLIEAEDAMGDDDEDDSGDDD
jgi:hypothetical protein